MAPEVVDLLSSSPVAIPARPHGETTSAIPPSNGHGELSGDDRPDTVQPLQSSPRHDVPTSAQRLPALPCGAIQTEEAEILFLSDDFDTTGDLDIQVSKRPRISSSIRKTRSEVVDHPNSSKRASRFDDIQYSSSPANYNCRTSREEMGVQESSDPFATSPPKIQSHKKSPIPYGPLPILSSDPFSSPPRQSKAWNGQHDPRGHSNATRPRGTGVGETKKPYTIDLSSDGDEGPSSDAAHKLTKGKQLAAWDPISSSAPEVMTGRFSPDVSSNHLVRTKNAMNLGEASDSDSEALPDLADVDFSQLKRTAVLSESPPSKKPRTTTSGAPKKRAADREQEKVAKAQAREAERERKKAEKEQARNLKAAEKMKQKALEEVNKNRTNHKISTPEMIVDLPDSLRPALKIQTETLLSDLGVDFESYHAPVDNVIKWRRKVGAKYDAEEGLWKDVPRHIVTEEHVLAILQAPEFVKLALGTEDQTLDSHVMRVRAAVPNASIIYLIEGLTAWMRKNRNVRNRQFVNNVRAEAPEAEPSQPRKRKTQPQEYIDEDSVEDALLCLQVSHGALIHHTGSMVETAQWISIFTQHISTVPYRRAQAESADAGFCMEAGQVRTGSDNKDTYVRMLQEIGRITAPIAYGIAAEFPSLGQLIEGLETQGPLVLAECRKSANQDGAFSDRRIGPAVSKRVHKIFTGRDPGSTDV